MNGDTRKLQKLRKRSEEVETEKGRSLPQEPPRRRTDLITHNLPIHSSCFGLASGVRIYTYVFEEIATSRSLY